jgi:recombination protein RecA
VATNQLRQRAGVSGQPLYTAGGRALGYYASVRLYLHHPRAEADQHRVVRSHIRVQVTKNKLAPAWQSCELEVHADHGLSAEASLLDLGLREGLIAERGGWVSYSSVRLGRGRQAAHLHLREHPELANRLHRELRGRLFTDTPRTVEAAAS